MEWIASLISVYDILVPPIYLLIIFFIAFMMKNKGIKKYNYYKYFMIGLLIKIFSGVAFGSIYAFYYQGGDTFAYYEGAVAMNKLMFYNFGHYLEILFGKVDIESYGYFNSDTSWPQFYMWRDHYTAFVIRIISPLIFLSFNSYFTGTILMGTISFVGAWKLYQFFIHFYPQLQKELAWSIFYIPSVAFWGSGILKDSITLFAISWLIFCVFKIFVLKQKIFSNVIIALIMVLLVVNIKPYILIALTPGLALWVSYQRITSIKNVLIRWMIFPSIILISGAFVLVLFSFFGEDLGKYNSYDSMITQAQTIQSDLSRSSQYGDNFYNVGEINSSFSGMLAIAPKSLIAGLYRPFLWEAKNVVLLISALENTFLMLFTLFLLYKAGIVNFFATLFSEPVVMFSFVFAIVFLFSVGMATANFGALVRYKIPAMPFFMASLFIVNHLKQVKKQQ